MARKKDTLLFDTPPVVAAWAAAGGKKESEGPLASDFDFLTQDAGFCEQGCENWEQAESLLQRRAAELCLRKADLPRTGVDIAFAGDLQAQCTASNYTMRELGIPFAGVYGACSTMAQGLALGGVLVEAGAAARLAVSASSHFCSAERQYRFPLAYGGQRTPTAQWTATAAGAAVLGAEGGSSVRMTHVLFGKMIELGVKDANNMGAAMAPAACDTLSCLLREIGAKPEDFDCIVTGDLGRVGADLLLTLLREDGIDLSPVYSDCGVLLFGDSQDAHAGGSGCGCSAAVLCGPLLRDMHEGKIRRMVFAGTGAMMSPTSVQQGQPIAGICHAVVLERSSR